MSFLEDFFINSFLCMGVLGVVMLVATIMAYIATKLSK